ncbi:MAG: phosphate ABC transporter substrate-binding/OmpA family protein [Patescibacteria group bacterium]
MNRTHWIVLVVCLVVVGAGFGIYQLLGWMSEKNAIEEEEKAKQEEVEKKQEEEAAKVNLTAAKDVKAEIRIALDSWAGYFFIRSEDMRKRMMQGGYLLKITDDKADYADRMKRLAAGEYDMVVATIDSDILNAAPYKYPGLIFFVIDESRGGDAVYARADKVKNLNDLRGKRVKVAFTPKSPTEHLLKVVKDRFNLPEILPVDKELRVETSGSEEALQKLMAGTVDVAGIWAPDTARAAAQKGLVKLIGTDDTAHVIVDVLIVNSNYAVKNKEVVRRFLINYFYTMKYYKDNPEILRTEIAKESGLTVEQADVMIKGLVWYGLVDNCTQWLGIAAPGESSREMIVDAINSTVDVLMSNGDFTENPLPNGNPYKIFSRDLLGEIYTNEFAGISKASATPIPGSLEAKFTPMAAEVWNARRDWGTLKVEPIIFQSGTARLTDDGKMALDVMVDKLKSFPNARVKVVGHTNTQGDPEENKKLSLERATAVRQYMIATYRIDPNRLFAVGLGGEKPFEQGTDEPDAAWQGRLKRVELVLVREDL